MINDSTTHKSIAFFKQTKQFQDAKRKSELRKLSPKHWYVIVLNTTGNKLECIKCHKIAKTKKDLDGCCYDNYVKLS